MMATSFFFLFFFLVNQSLKKTYIMQIIILLAHLTVILRQDVGINLGLVELAQSFVHSRSGSCDADCLMHLILRLLHLGWENWKSL